MQEAGRKTGRRCTRAGGLVLKSGSHVLKIRTNLSGHMYKDRKKNRNRSNIVTATV